MKDCTEFRSFSLIVAICAGFMFLVSGFLAWILDSFIWEWLETAARNDPFFLSKGVKFFIAWLKIGNQTLLTGAGLFMAAGVGLRYCLPLSRQVLVGLFAIAMLLTLGFPVMEWKILDDMFLDPEESYHGFSGSLRSIKWISALIAVTIALVFARCINRLTELRVRE
ncbi:MAG: hypothetical protein H6581_15650 [Bacteroidia bacterium]|nr:hypothetical protein [Bacteroidia bacterium]